MVPHMPSDGDGYKIQGALSPIIAHKITISSTSARNSTPFTCAVVRITANCDCFIKFGGNTVEATTSDHFLPEGIVEYFAIRDGKYLAAITDTSGSLYISEMI